MARNCPIQFPDGTVKNYVSFADYKAQLEKGDIVEVPGKPNSRWPSGRLKKWPTHSTSTGTPCALTHLDTLRNVGINPRQHSTRGVSAGTRRHETKKLDAWKAPIIGAAIPDPDKLAESQRVRASYGDSHA